MGPEITLRIGAMLRAIKEVIIPAIDPKARLALEQAHLLSNYLQLIDAQYDKITQFRLKEIREFAALLEELLRLADRSRSGTKIKAEVEAAFAPLRVLTTLQVPEYSILSDAVMQMRTMSDQLASAVLEDADPALSTQLGHLLIDHSRKEILRERAWVLRAGIDQNPAELPSLDELLRTDD